MKRNDRLKALAVLFTALLIVMFISKPSRRDFKDYINHSIEDRSDNVFEGLLSKLGSEIGSTIETKDYIFFTYNEYALLGQEKLGFIGVFGYFVLIGEV